MGVRIWEGTLDGGRREAAGLYCSTTDWAFGPLFDDYEEADAFLEYLPCDPRSIKDSDLEDHFGAFKKMRAAAASPATGEQNPVTPT